MTSDCIFCKISEHTLPADIVYEDEDLVAFNDIGPQAPTHVLIIPKIHIASVNELTDTNSEIVGKLVLRAKDLATERGLAERGYRLVMNCNDEGGQTVFHPYLTEIAEFEGNILQIPDVFGLVREVGMKITERV